MGCFSCHHSLLQQLPLHQHPWIVAVRRVLVAHVLALLALLEGWEGNSLHHLGVEGIKCMNTYS